MKGFKKFNLLQLLLLVNTLFSASAYEEIPVNYCGSIKIQDPFFHQNSSLLRQMILCKSEKLYFRTSIGLFQIQSINHKNKVLTLTHTHTSCSSTSHFVSPQHLSAGFPPPPPSASNSLLLFNCSKPSSDIPLLPCNSTALSCESQGDQRVESCLLIEEVEALKEGFDPKQMMGCTHYSSVYRSSSGEEFELGTRISFDIPDHVPNTCNECKKPYANCGAGLRCACYPKKCS